MMNTEEHSLPSSLSLSSITGSHPGPDERVNANAIGQRGLVADEGFEIDFVTALSALAFLLPRFGYGTLFYMII